MSNERTPTTDEVRGGWIVGETRDGHGVDHDDLVPAVAAEFDRWLAETVRAARAEAWDACVSEGEACGHIGAHDASELEARNPYRTTKEN